MNSLKKIHILMIFILAGAYNAVYSLVFMKSIYYQLMQDGLGLTHFRLGQLYSVFGMTSMVSYLLGAYFLSRFKCWKLVSVSLLITGALTMYLAAMPPYPVMAVIFGVVGFLLGAVFYSAHLQVLHNIGAPYCQGTVFSLFYVFNGLMGIVFASAGLGLTALDAPDPALMRLLFLFFGIINIIIALFAAVILRKLDIDPAEQMPVRLESVRHLAKNRRLWLVIAIVFTNYIAFSSLNYILLFLESMYAVPAAFMDVLLIMRTYLIFIIAGPIAGRITDRFRSASRLMKYSFLLNAAVLEVMLLLGRFSYIIMLLCILLSCLFINMGKSMALLTVDEAGISPAFYGIAVSFISFCAYSPDAFYYSMSGAILDLSPENGYSIVFLIVVVVSLAGFILSRFLEKSDRTQ